MLRMGFHRVEEPSPRADGMPWEQSSGAILHQSDGIAGEVMLLLKGFRLRQFRSTL